jgi:hypothetical protein
MKDAKLAAYIILTIALLCYFFFCLGQQNCGHRPHRIEIKNN